MNFKSRFNPECNTERGFIDSLAIALGLRFIVLLTSPVHKCAFWHGIVW